MDKLLSLQFSQPPPKIRIQSVFAPIMLGSVLRVATVVCTALAASVSAAVPGNMGVNYSPFHSQAYPLHGEYLPNLDGLRAAIDNDFKQMAGSFSHVRTYYSQYVGLDVTPIAAKYGIKLYLGVFLTTDSWGQDQVNAAVRAVQQFPDTIEAIMVGNENLANGQGNANTIINTVNQIKSLLGPQLASKVKFGTAQRVTEYLDSSLDGQMGQLNTALDILGVNIYPFFTNGYDPANPTVLLDQMWKNVAAKYPANKLVLTETGFPTAGSSPSNAPNNRPSLDNSVGYYQGVVKWVPQGAEGSTKFWFMAYDLRADDTSMGVDYETYFGFWTANGQSKRANFP